MIKHNIFIFEFSLEYVQNAYLIKRFSKIEKQKEMFVIIGGNSYNNFSQRNICKREGNSFQVRFASERQKVIKTLPSLN